VRGGKKGKSERFVLGKEGRSFVGGARGVSFPKEGVRKKIPERDEHEDEQSHPNPPRRKPKTTVVWPVGKRVGKNGS